MRAPAITRPASSSREMSLLDAELLSRRYFFPRGESAPGALCVEVEGARLHCVASLHHAQRPLLVHFHGNGETAAEAAAQWARPLDACGIDSLFVEYRGYGGSTGTPGLVRQLNDGVACLAAVARPVERVFAYGRSLGSAYAVNLARSVPALGGLILESGIADMAERVRKRVTADELGTTAEALAAEIGAHFDHQATLRAYDGRTLVLHAVHDRTLDISHGRRLAKWARHGALVTFDTGDHHSIAIHHHAALVHAVAEFIARPPAQGSHR